MVSQTNNGKRIFTDLQYTKTSPSAGDALLAENASGDISWGTLGIGAGGTGQTTKTAAFDALSPLTIGGLVGHDGNNNVMIPTGSNGQVLLFDYPASSTGIKWGEISNNGIATGAAIARSKIAVGGANHVIINDVTGALSSLPVLSASYGGTGVSAYSKGDLLTGTVVGLTNLSVGTNGYMLQADSSQSEGMKWAVVKENVTMPVMGSFVGGTFPTDNLFKSSVGGSFNVVEDGAVFARLDSSGAEAGYTSNYQVFPDSPANSDAVYFGNSDPFCVMYIDVSTVGVYTGDACIWEVYNGVTWATLTLLYDGTGGTTTGTRPFTKDGYIAWAIPTWGETTVNLTTAYWIRCRITNNTAISTSAIFNSTNFQTVAGLNSTQIPYANSISRARINFGTASSGGTDTKYVLMNLTQQVTSNEITVTSANQESASVLSMTELAADDALTLFVTQGDSTPAADAMLELTVTRT